MKQSFIAPPSLKPVSLKHKMAFLDWRVAGYNFQGRAAIIKSPVENGEINRAKPAKMLP